MFSRSKRNPPVDEAPVVETRALPTLTDDDPVWSRPGPRTIHEVDPSSGYVDMGAIRIPAIQGMQLRTQVADDQKTVLRVLVVLGASGIQMSVAAAPRSGGVWDELREQIRQSLVSDGATVEDVDSRYGRELLADIPVSMPDGRTATSKMRIIGREGDRWFSRIDVLGPAAVSPEAGAELEKVIDRIVVVRDDQPRARLDLLPIHVPSGAVEVPGA
ncbi:DUF3710 domain-containing protein [Actinomyces sp. B33]|uniref:DUF3710 domain-containing protein n=1 Tax=Actinomyces sp. B33 TaxID=2942131 RepID=UPI00233FE266|nr:DUF3710 domain-containing protein [Actinomyces sp. B33]MDC4233188.1 DUF3710 domain-containing protein [Actinomyces sp. B33]